MTRERSFGKSEDSGERISVFNVAEKFAGHGIHCLSCYYTNDAMDPLLWQV